MSEHDYIFGDAGSFYISSVSASATCFFNTLLDQASDFFFSPIFYQNLSLEMARSCKYKSKKQNGKLRI